MKICKDCDTNKPFSEYYSQRKRSKKRGEYIYYPPYCKQCQLIRSGNWQTENSERYKDNLKEWYINNKHEPKRIEQIRVATKEYRDRGGQLDWQRNNTDKLKEYGQQHRKHDITTKEWLSCKAYFNNECAYCGLTIDLHETDLHKEHVHHDGVNDLSNCVPACKSCNSQQWVYDLDYWYKQRSGIFSESKYTKLLKWINEDHKQYISKIKD